MQARGDSEHLTTGAAAERIGISRHTLLRAVRRGEVRPALVTPGGRLRFLPEDIEAFARRLTNRLQERSQVEEARRADAERMAAIIRTQHEVMTTSLDLDAVMTLVAERAQALTGASGAVVELVEGDELVYRAVSGTAAPYLGRRIPATGTLAGLCVRMREILRCDDTQHDPRTNPVSCKKRGIGSMIVVPLYADRAVVGVLKVVSPQPRAFDEHDMRTLQLMVGLLSAAMDHAMDFSANQTLLQEYEVILEAMDQSEQRARILIERSPIGTCIVDEHGIFETVNTAYAAIYGYSPEEMVGRHCTMVLSEDRHEESMTHVRERLADGVEVTTEYEVVNKHGQLLVVRSTGVTLPGSDGRPRRAGFIIDITEQKRHEQQLAHAAHHAALTGLPNRVLFSDRLKQALLTAERQRATLAVMQIDLNRFKEINDTYGHAAGDQVLATVAERMSKVLRASDTVARLGGDEFAILLPGAEDAGAVAVASKIRIAVCRPIALPDHSVTVGASIGIALYPEQSENAAVLLHNADVAMYTAKAAGGGAVVYSPVQDEHSDPSRTLAGELRQAIGAGQLRLYFQPIVDCIQDRAVRVEALVRWQHPTLGLLYPDRFIPLAEQTGSIGALTLWVLEESLRQCRAWHDEGLLLGISVNISIHTLQDGQFPDLIRALLRQHAVAPENLTLEISEHALMTEPEKAMVVLDALIDLGIRIAIDHFGTGHSSLTMLSQLRLHELKLDRGFVLRADSPTGAALISFTLGLSTTLGLSVVVEGVERQDTWEWLKILGCQTRQGYYLGRPMPAAELAHGVGGAKQAATQK